MHIIYTAVIELVNLLEGILWQLRNSKMAATSLIYTTRARGVVRIILQRL